MKKIRAILLCIAMAAAIALTGCGGDSGSSSGSDSVSDSTSEAKENAGNVATVFSSNLGDKSFCDSCWAGLNEIKDKYGVEIDYFEMKSDQTKAIPALTEFAESGNYGLIVSGGPTTIEAAQNVIEQFPNQNLFITTPPFMTVKTAPMPTRSPSSTSRTRVPTWWAGWREN